MRGLRGHGRQMQETVVFPDLGRRLGRAVMEDILQAGGAEGSGDVPQTIRQSPLAAWLATASLPSCCVPWLLGCHYQHADCNWLSSQCALRIVLIFNRHKIREKTETT